MNPTFVVNRIALALGLGFLLTQPGPAAESRWLPDPKPRVFVLTDIANEPDDEQSLVRLLVYANEFDIEGLVATTSTHLRHTTRVDLIHRQLDAYAQVRDNLLRHAPERPGQRSPFDRSSGDRGGRVIAI